MIAAGGHDVRVGESIADLTPIPLRLDDARGAEHRQVLGDVRLRGPDRLGQTTDLDRTAGEHVQDLEPSWAGEGLEDLGLEDRDLVHALTIDICAGADECRLAPNRGPQVTILRARGEDLAIVLP